MLNNLSMAQDVSVVRAFTCLSHMANLAKDQYHLRRRRWHKRVEHRQAGSSEQAVARLLREGMTASRFP